MGVKSVKKKESEVKVDQSVVDSNVEMTEETAAEETTETADATEETSTPAVEVTETSSEDSESETAPAEDDVKVDVDTTPIDMGSQATPKNVRIRMRCDHRCWVGTELYDLKKGQCYNVPLSVKKRLNKADVLLPL